MPGDELGLCPCGHRAAMCHKVNAQKWCGGSDNPYDLNEALDHLESFLHTDKISEHMEEEEYTEALRFVKKHGRLKYWVIDDHDVPMNWNQFD